MSPRAADAAADADAPRRPRAARTARTARTAPKHAPRMPFAVLVVGLVVGGLCMLLALNTASAANELRRHDLAATDQSVADQVVALHNEVAQSAAPANLASAAAQLGMVPDDNPAFLQIESDGRIRALGSPVAVTTPPAPKPTPTPTITPSPERGAATTSAKSAAGKTPKAANSPKNAKSSSSSSMPPPSPSPTPNITLPGGPR
jgi:hypothetical protein